ncbi:MAG: class I SAM-dependent methyltransferase [Candidatus Obscuribacterales bacterium]|nr:class I SAM-dependent methyltransferase [Candidatus Obscuribacterales bacterium]
MNGTDIKTISDFGSQWTNFTRNDGYYGSLSLLQDIFGPLLSVDELKGKELIEIGSGTGRIVNMTLAAGASKVTAVEPSEAYQVLKENVKENSARVRMLNCPGNQIDFENEFDLALSIGVLHHTTTPAPILKKMVQSLKPGGKCLIWLYGFEGNELYLATFGVLRTVTTKLPDPLLFGLAEVLTVAADFYTGLCKFVNLPMKDYMLNHLGKLDRAARKLTVVDQLNPAYAKYYKKEEALALMKSAGLVNIKLHRRHGYSWTVMGEKEQ